MKIAVFLSLEEYPFILAKIIWSNISDGMADSTEIN